MILGWTEFKSFILTKSLSIQFVESNNVYAMWATDIVTHECLINKSSPASDDQTDFETNYKSAGNKAVRTEVVTQLEKEDKSLTLASDMQSFVGNVCTLSIQVPGNVGDIGRYIAGGYGFTDVYCFGDRVSKVQLVDKNYVYAGIAYPATPAEAGIPGTAGLSWQQVMPDGVILGSYHDEDVPAVQQGWRLWADDGGQGGVDIDPLGGFGKLYAQAYLVIRMEKLANSLATKASVNLWWGKVNL